MHTTIRPMSNSDRDEVLDMMRTFYNSSAVYTNGSEDIYINDFENCINDCPYLEGYIFCEDECIKGYGMVAKSFSTEFGKLCIWIEDIYIKPDFRGLGIGSIFLNEIKIKYPQCIHRLEVEDENVGAIKTYEKNEFTNLPYKEMIRNS